MNNEYKKCKKGFFYERNLFFLLQKISFLFLGKQFNCLSVFIAKASTIKWRYALAKALTFANCQGEFRMLNVKDKF